MSGTISPQRPNESDTGRESPTARRPMKTKTRLSLAAVTIVIILANIQPAPSQIKDVSAPKPIKESRCTLACGGDLQAAINAATGPTTITVAHLQKDGVTRCNWANSYALP